MTTTDPLTGLPELPDGYFWEIRRALTTGMYRLELRKKYLGIFSERVQFAMMESPLSHTRIYRKAEVVLDDWKRHTHRVSLMNRSDTFLGKYPPKTLKDDTK